MTISGPPTILQDLLSFRTLKARSLPIQTPFHADHLYTSEDVAEEYDRPLPKHLRSYTLRTPIISPVSGILVQEGSLESLLRRATQDALCEQVRWDRIMPACERLIASDIYDACSVLPCASNAALFLFSSLSSIPAKNVTISSALHTSIDENQPAPSNGRFSDSKIAIVGFSGRFPDAACNDELWSLLNSGKDTHRLIPKDRFDWESHFDASGTTKNTSRVKHGCFIDEPVSQSALDSGTALNIM